MLPAAPRAAFVVLVCCCWWVCYANGGMYGITPNPNCTLVELHTDGHVSPVFNLSAHDLHATRVSIAATDDKEPRYSCLLETSNQLTLATILLEDPPRLAPLSPVNFWTTIYPLGLKWASHDLIIGAFVSVVNGTEVRSIATVDTRTWSVSTVYSFGSGPLYADGAFDAQRNWFYSMNVNGVGTSVYNVLWTLDVTHGTAVQCVNVTTPSSSWRTPQQLQWTIESGLVGLAYNSGDQVWALMRLDPATGVATVVTAPIAATKGWTVDVTGSSIEYDSARGPLLVQVFSRMGGAQRKALAVSVADASVVESIDVSQAFTSFAAV